MTEKSKIVKADGYNEIFKGEQRVAQPFYMHGLAKTSLASFYETDGLAKRIIDVIPEDMVSPGFKVEGIADEAAFRSLWDEKKLNAKIIDALCWSRLFGGAGIVAIVADGRMFKSPAKPVSFLPHLPPYPLSQIRVTKL